MSSFCNGKVPNGLGTQYFSRLIAQNHIPLIDLEVVLELASVLGADGDGFVLCLGGRRGCPPEDVGGVDGYKRFLDIVEDPEN